MKFFKPLFAMMWWIDSRAINWIFQPITNAVAPVISCYALAAFLLTGSIPLLIVTWWYWGLWWAILFSMPWMPSTLVRAYRLEASPTFIMMVHERISNLPLRVGLLLIFLGACPLHIFLIIYGKFSSTLEIAGWWMMIVALYFMACQPMPPKRKLVRKLA